jgi:hypothetical protein
MRPLKLQEYSDELIEENFVEIYRRLYYKYEEEKHCIPVGNLMELKFEDFETDSLSLTEDIYRSLDIPGFSEARGAIEKYIREKKGYKKNQYTYSDHTIKTVEEKWNMTLKNWRYGNE